MGNKALSSPKIHLNTWSNKHLKAGGASIQSYRASMEDFEVHQSPFVFPSWTLHILLDGHGGTQAALHVKKKFPTILSQCLRDDFSQEFEDYIEPEEKDLKTNITKAFHLMDEDLRSVCQDDSGACCLVVISSPTKIITAWCGDCALFRIRTDFTVERLTTDHIPTLPQEINRIQAAESIVYNGRIDSTLNVSRAFGDFFLKPLKRERTIIKGGKKRSIEIVTLTPETFPVICTPDIEIFQKDKTDLGFLLCTDGLLKVPNIEEELLWKDIFQEKFLEGYKQPHQLATYLVDYAFRKKSLDNTTVSILFETFWNTSNERNEMFKMYLGKRNRDLLGCVCATKSGEEECQSCLENGEQETNIHVEE